MRNSIRVWQNGMLVMLLALVPLVVFAGDAGGNAGTAETVKIKSAKMNKDVPAVIILPEAYPATNNASFPVLYLLNGYSDNQDAWPSRTDIRALASRYKMIVVCPDAGFSSWYFDSFDDPTYQYETFVSSELVKFVDGTYRTIKDKKHRAIAGLSMGGHGALFLAIRHKDVFGVVSAMSGGVDLRPYPNGWDIAKRIGSFKDHPERWEELSVINLVNTLKNGELAISIDVGVSDIFVEVNRNLHKKLIELKINHDYTERAGGMNGITGRTPSNTKCSSSMNSSRSEPNGSIFTTASPIHQDRRKENCVRRAGQIDGSNCRGSDAGICTCATLNQTTRF